MTESDPGRTCLSTLRESGTRAISAGGCDSGCNVTPSEGGGIYRGLSGPHPAMTPTRTRERLN